MATATAMPMMATASVRFSIMPLSRRSARDGLAEARDCFAQARHKKRFD